MLVFLSRYQWPLLFSAIAIAYPALCLLVGDIIPVKDGLGYDGDRWAQYAQRIRPWMLTRRIDAYSFQKSLSWFILGGSYWVIGKFSTAFAEAMQTFNVTIALVSYWIANSICLAGTAFLWKGILDDVKVREPVALLSYFLLFVSVGNLRMPAFYVTISDVQMTLVGTLALYLFIKSRQSWLLPLGFLSGFVRAGLPEAVALLVLFPRRQPAPSQDASRQDRSRGWFGAATAAFAVVAIAATSIWYIEHLQRFTVAGHLLWVSVLILCVYVGTALYFLLRGLPIADLRPRLADVGKAVLVVLPVAIVLKLVASPSVLPPMDFIREVVGTGTYFPGVSLVAMVVYYGPGFLLLILLFPRCAKAAERFGPGLLAFLSLGICMTMFSESRIAAVYVPAFLFVVTLVLSDMRELARWGYYATAALCVLFSKIWLPMRWSDSYSETFSRFPEQLYFMNFGPYMSVQTFALQTAACVVAMLILAHWLYDLRIVARAMRVVLSPYKWPLLFSAIVIFYPALCIASGDIIPVRAGLGYDGAAWAKAAQTVGLWMLDGSIDAYTFQKSSTWFILGATYWVVGTLSPAFADFMRGNFNVPVALISFWLLNSICLAGSAFLWKCILDELKVREPAALLSYFLLFVSVGNLRMAAFYVTISDVQMTLVGTLALYLFIKSRQLWLLPVGFLSGFVRSGCRSLSRCWSYSRGAMLPLRESGSVVGSRPRARHSPWSRLRLPASGTATACGSLLPPLISSGCPR
jgi:hypothetical protein